MQTSTGGPAAGTRPQPQVLRIFISYSRRDIAVAERLVSRLEEQGLEVLIDRRDLPYGEEWQKELADFIRLSDTVVWLVSPDSVASKWVNWELGEVGRLSKRLVPLRVRDVDPADLPEALGRIHLLPAEGVFDFDRHFVPLVDTLNTDRGWLKEATRLADRARQWIAKDRDKGLLLYRRALTDAENWSRAKPASVPPIGSEILELLLNSRRATVRRQRQFVVGAVSLAIVGFGLAFFSWQQRNAALANQSTYLAALSRDSLQRGDAGTSLLLAMSALPKWRFALDRPYVPEAGRSLYDAMLSVREGKILRGHTADVNTAQFSSDDRLVVTSSDDRTARVWDAATGSMLRVLGPHTGRVLSARFSPDDTLIVTRTEDNNVYVWDTGQGHPRHTLSGHTDKITSVDFLDARTVISTSLDATARIWRLDAQDAPTVLRGHQGAVVTAATSPDGQRVVTSANDKSVKVWSQSASKPHQWTASRTFPALAAVLDSTGSRMASLSGDNVVTIGEVDGPTSVSWKKEGAAIVSMTLCPAGRCLITTDTDGRAELWNAAAGDDRIELKGHTKSIMDVAIDPAGRLGATVSLDGVALVWDLEARSQVLALAGHGGEIFDAAFSHSGESLVTASRDRTARIWRISAPTTTESRTRFESRSMDVTAAVDIAAFGGMDGTVCLVSATSLVTIASASLGTTPITFVAFDKQGTRLLAGSESGDVALFSVPKLNAIFRTSTDGSEVGGGGFDPSGPGMSVLTTSGTRFEFEAGADDQPVRRQSSVATGDNILVAVFSRDLRRALIGRFDGQATIVDIGGGSRPLIGHRGAILHAAFDETGRRVATASEDGTARLWNVETAAMLQQLDGFQNPVPFVAVAEDGGSLATASPDRTVKLWNFGDSSPVAIYRGHLAPTGLVRLLPNRSGVISVSEDGEIHRWGFFDDYRAMLQRARTAVPRCLTQDQAAAFGVSKPSRDGCPSETADADATTAAPGMGTSTVR